MKGIAVVLIQLHKCLSGEQINTAWVFVCLIRLVGVALRCTCLSPALQSSTVQLLWGHCASSQESDGKQSAAGWLMTSSISPTKLVCLFLCRLFFHLGSLCLSVHLTHPVNSLIISGGKICRTILSFLHCVWIVLLLTTQSMLIFNHTKPSFQSTFFLASSPSLCPLFF